MQDFISKGEGKSRFLKSVSDFLEQYPSYEDFAAALIAGTLPVDFNGFNPDGVAQAGTDLTKANLLTDATATAIKNVAGILPNTPNEALAAMAEAVKKVPSENIVASAYIGTGTASATISLSFTPRAVLILSEGSYTTNTTGGVLGGMAITNTPAMWLGKKSIEIVSNGFTVTYNSESKIFLNDGGRSHSYIAFK